MLYNARTFCIDDGEMLDVRYFSIKVLSYQKLKSVSSSVQTCQILDSSFPYFLCRNSHTIVLIVKWFEMGEIFQCKNEEEKFSKQRRVS